MNAISSTLNAEVSGQSGELEKFRHKINERLEELVPDTGKPAEAARHSLLAPGKRLRAILTLLAAAECGGDPFRAIDAACAIEMVHTASLIFDDLPAMDDADLRRGQSTPHVVFGDGVAILAGIGLLNGAFGVISADKELTPSQVSIVVKILSDSIGWSGLVSGQALDLVSSDQDAELTRIHDEKTGVLFEAALLSGAVIAGKLEDVEMAFREYARELGRAYQALDDILDHVADDMAAGKSTRRDGGKLTAISSHSQDDALDRAMKHLESAKAALGVKSTEQSSLIQFANHIGEHFRTIFAASRPQDS